MRQVVFCLFLVLGLVVGAFADAANPTQLRQMTQIYQIVPGDLLDISVWKEDGLTSKALVSPDGGISFPLIGSVHAEGLTADQLKNEITKRLSEYVSDPVITVSILSSNQKVYVVGKVNKPGEVHLSNPTTVMQALSIAGGLSPFADEDDIKILRQSGGQTITLPFDYSSISKGEELQKNIQLINGDVILVP